MSTATKTAAYTPQQLREVYGLFERAVSITVDDPTSIVIDITHNLTALNVPELQVIVAHAIARGHRNFTVDLADCPYIDRRGLSGLEKTAHFIRDHRGELVVANAHRDLKTLFDIKGLARLVRYHDAGATHAGSGGARS